MTGARFLPVLILFAAAGFAADLTGIWIGEVQVRENVKQDVSFQLIQKGTSIEGKLYGEYVSYPITEGKIDGDSISFAVTTAEQAGNQINEIKLRFTGTLKNGELEIVRQRESANIAGNGGAVHFKGDSKQTFRLKKLV